MDVTTYRSPKVITLAPLQVLDCEVDQDSRPDLSNRYEDHGWPATVVFDGDGQIVKRQGYLPPEAMASMLNAIIDGPTPGPSVQREPEISFPANPPLSAALRAQLNKNYIAGYDTGQGSWGFDQKIPRLGFCRVRYRSRRPWRRPGRNKARQTLEARLELLDPAWGVRPHLLRFILGKSRKRAGTSIKKAHPKKLVM